MNKNFELVQRAQFGLGTARVFATAQDPLTAESVAPAASQVLSPLDSVVREEALKLVQRLFLGPGPDAPKAVLFAAIDANSGCNRLCSVAGRLLAQSAPGSVCLVEGNFRSSSSSNDSFSNTLGVDRDRGLVDSLGQDGSIREFAKQIELENLWLLSSGAPTQDSIVLLNSERMKDRLNELRKEFDYLLINAPPLNAFADGMVLGRLVDGVVLVLDAKTTRREAALRVMETLRATNIPVLGAVLNNRTFPIPAAVYKRL